MAYGIAKLKPQSLHEQVYGQIKRLIFENRLRPGDQVVIGQIAREMGVSQTPIREALMRLNSEGHVVMEHHRVAWVSTVEPKDVRDLYELRMVIEGWASHQAAQVMDDQQLDELTRLLEDARRSGLEGQRQLFIASDVEFHAAITRATGNKMFIRFMRTLSDQSLRIRSLAETTSDAYADVIERATAEHLRIVEALRHLDPEQSRSAMVAHLEAAMARTLSALQQSDSATARY